MCSWFTHNSLQQNFGDSQFGQRARFIATAPGSFADYVYISGPVNKWFFYWTWSLHRLGFSCTFCSRTHFAPKILHLSHSQTAITLTKPPCIFVLFLR